MPDDMHEWVNPVKRVPTERIASVYADMYSQGMAFSLPDAITDYMAKAGISQEEFADKVGVGQSTVSRWLAGKAPSAKGWVLLSKIIGDIYIEHAVGMYLSEPEVKRPLTAPTSGPLLGDRNLPVYSAVEGGLGDIIVSTDPIDMVPRPWYLNSVKDGFAVIVTGESMSPLFEPGDMVIVNPKLPPVREKNVILIADMDHGEFRAMVKRLVSWTTTHWRLRQYNPPHEFEVPRERWSMIYRIVGKYEG